MRDKIELLIEETGAPHQEAELALGLAGFDMEQALKILHGRMKDVFVVKAKFLCQHPQMYGLMLLMAHVPNVSSGPTFRLRFVFSGNPHLYETDLGLDWYDFEKAIYRARLSEWCYVAVSQAVEKEWEDKITAEAMRLNTLKESLLAGRQDALVIWLEGLVAASHCWRIPPKFVHETAILSLSEYRQGPMPAVDSTRILWSRIEAAERLREGEIFLNLRIALLSALPPRPPMVLGSARPVIVSAGELRAGDVVQVYVLETRESGLYLAEIFGGYSEHGLAPIEAPIESVWQEGDLIGIRVRFGYAVVGEGTFPSDLRVLAIRRKVAKPSLFKRILNW
ncbi:MAG: hypothetical protein HYT79_04935 [Elusimicrobia bacterium]|nr:hypothetical protein [Elusimicrobiota bacterium]